MSLINDALKRAKLAQQAQPPASPGLQFRPVEASQNPKRSFDWVIPALVAIVAAFAWIFMWPWADKTELTRVAASKGPSPIVAKEVSVPATAQPPPAVVTVDSSQVPPTATSPGPAPTEAATNPAVAASETSAVPSPAVIAEPPPPKPAPLRLQAIVYNPTRPSAIINGRTLFVGDKFTDFRVLAISRESAILAGRGQTNVLTLSE